MAKTFSRNFWPFLLLSIMVDDDFFLIFLRANNYWFYVPIIGPHIGAIVGSVFYDLFVGLHWPSPSPQTPLEAAKVIHEATTEVVTNENGSNNFNLKVISWILSFFFVWWFYWYFANISTINIFCQFRFLCSISTYFSLMKSFTVLIIHGGRTWNSKAVNLKIITQIKTFFK